MEVVLTINNQSFLSRTGPSFLYLTTREYIICCADGQKYRVAIESKHLGAQQFWKKDEEKETRCTTIGYLYKKSKTDPTKEERLTTLYLTYEKSMSEIFEDNGNDTLQKKSKEMLELILKEI